MARKRELEQRILSLEHSAKESRDSISLLRDQLDCGLAHHSCGHDGHLFKYVGKPEFLSGDAYVNCGLVPGFYSDAEPETSQDRDKVGRFKCKFCDIIMTRKMTPEELDAVGKLSP